MVWVKDTATLAKDTLVREWPMAWQIATRVTLFMNAPSDMRGLENLSDGWKQPGTWKATHLELDNLGGPEKASNDETSGQMDHGHEPEKRSERTSQP
eukprot:7496755-Pyramimonas_sp.AAC.1